MKRHLCTKEHRCPACGGRILCTTHHFVQAQQEAIRSLQNKLRRLKTEEHWMLWLDRNMNQIGGSMTGRGSEDECRISLHEIVRQGCRRGARFAVALHNHPGDPWPWFSSADKRTATDIVGALDAVGITMLDDIVVCSNGRWLSAAAVNRASHEMGRRKRCRP